VPGSVKAYQKISDVEGNFDGVLDTSDQFGSSVTSIGDLDGDSVNDLVVGAEKDDDGGDNCGAVWVLFLQNDGTVKSHQKISNLEGSFNGGLEISGQFGYSATSIGDLDGDGVTDLVVGALSDDDGGAKRGAVHVLFLKTDGTVKSHQKISDLEGNFAGVLDDGDLFGGSVTSINDLDGDGVIDLVVGAHKDGDGGTARGAVWVLFLQNDGRVKSFQKVSSSQGSFAGTLNDDDKFGASVTSIGDLDGDSVSDLVVGAHHDDEGGWNNTGAVWVLFLLSNGTVKGFQKISNLQGSFAGVLRNSDYFGFDTSSIGDLDGDSVTDLVVGAFYDDDGGDSVGAVWVLFLQSDGTVRAFQKISDLYGSFGGVLDDNDHFGRSVAMIGDLDGDGVNDLAVGAHKDDDGNADTGAVWILFLHGEGTR
jgi:hypothetical protein